ncbi:P53-Induced Death Domain-Containing Protein 1 [Manis pentadactyla]|nr:P53-Induced Death Domain-Containing Protein 1 [Manis pentadactyla]
MHINKMLLESPYILCFLSEKRSLTRKMSTLRSRAAQALGEQSSGAAPSCAAAEEGAGALLSSCTNQIPLPAVLRYHCNGARLHLCLVKLEGSSGLGVALVEALASPGVYVPTRATEPFPAVAARASAEGPADSRGWEGVGGYGFVSKLCLAEAMGSLRILGKQENPQGGSVCPGFPWDKSSKAPGQEDLQGAWSLGLVQWCLRMPGHSLGIRNSFPGPHTSRCEVCPELSYLEEMQLTRNVQCLSRDQDCPATAHSTQHKAGAWQVLRAVVEGSGHCIPDGD